MDGSTFFVVSDTINPPTSRRYKRCARHVLGLFIYEKKTITLVATMMGLTLTISAQDIIVTKQSERITANILEVSDSEVKYKRFDNPEGPTFTIATKKIDTVTYANGEMQTFGKKSKNNGQPFDANLFNFLPESTTVTRSLGAHAGYVLPDPTGLTEGGDYKFPSNEISIAYGYYFNNRIYTGVTVGFFDFTNDMKENIIENNNSYSDYSYAYIPVRKSETGIPIGIDLKYTLSSKKVKPTVGARVGFTIPLVSSQASEGSIARFHGSYAGHGRYGYGGSDITEGYDAFYREIATAREYWTKGLWGGINIGVKVNKVAFEIELLYIGKEYEYTSVTKERYYGHPDGEATNSESWRSGDLFLNFSASVDIFTRKIK